MLTAEHLLPTLKRLGINLDRNRPFDRSAKLVNTKETNKEGDVIHEAFLGQLSREECEQGISSSPEAIQEAFQVLKKRQCPPPAGGYPYSKNDHVTTKLGRLPPPCKVCGSDNHWDRECPDWDVYRAKQQKSAYKIELREEEELESYYSSVYSVLVADRLAREHTSPQDSEKDFDEAVLRTQEINLKSRERKSYSLTDTWKKQSVFAEEIEDELKRNPAFICCTKMETRMIWNNARKRMRPLKRKFLSPSLLAQETPRLKNLSNLSKMNPLLPLATRRL